MGRAGSGLTVQISIKSDINKGDKICMITDETYCLINMYIHWDMINSITTSLGQEGPNKVHMMFQQITLPFQG